MPINPPHVVGVDLSYTATGIAWPSATDIFETKPVDGPDHVRAAIIASHVCAHARDADLVCIEAGVYRSSHAFMAGVLHGVVYDRLTPMWERVLLVPPGTLKKYATGKGNADKTAMVVAARERLGYEGMNDNEADALWLRAHGMALLGRPMCELPAKNLEALEKAGGGR